jgi:glycosyltransferase involved in cell wall biosynthesis
MSSKHVSLSVVMPAYNEEAAIEEAVRDVQAHVFTSVPNAELIVVDDGSRDQTGEILDRLESEDARIRVIHQKNGGHGSALRAGMDAACGDFLLLIDSDRQIPLSAFPLLWAAARTRDGAFGCRGTRHDPWMRLALTAIVRTTLRPLFGVRLHDANIPFKILRRAAWQDARPLISEDSLAPSLFLAIFMIHQGYDVAVEDVPHRERQTGVVSIRRWKLLKFCGRAFSQLIVFRSKLNRASARRATAPALS